jgi:cytochrome c-type biogenesis protein CcmH
MAAIVVVVLVLASGGTGPRTNAERIDAIAKTIKCPTCVGESVYVSQAVAAEDIKEEIARQVGGGRTDDEVQSYFAERLGDEFLLTPPAGGLGALTWILPVVVLVLAFGGLGFAFARWRTVLAARPDDADRALVDAALARDAGLDDGRAGEGSGQ